MGVLSLKTPAGLDQLSQKLGQTVPSSFPSAPAPSPGITLHGGLRRPVSSRSLPIFSHRSFPYPSFVHLNAL